MTLARSSLAIEGHRPLRVVEARGREALSELFSFRVRAHADAPLAAADVVGRAATLVVAAGAEPRRVHGIVARLEELDEPGGATDVTVVEATLVPAVWPLSLGQDSRVFEDASVPDVANAVLRGAGVPDDAVRFVLHGDYPRRPQIVQLCESDWSFLSRLFEAEGIHTTFEHGDDGAVLVVSDTAASHEPIEGDRRVPFARSAGALATREHVERFRWAEEVRPGKVSLRGHRPENPGSPLESSAGADAFQDAEIYDAAPAGATQRAHDARAKIRLEAAQALRRSGAGEATSPRFSPGRTFELTGHPRDELNRGYLLVSVEHELTLHGDAPAYTCTFVVVPDDVSFRPALCTPRPRVRGVQTAMVVGPRGEEIHTDVLGRVRIRFSWDRQERRDERSSCWVRVSQAWAGRGFGALFVPRVGQEVVVDFVDGDPDQPIVVGGVYHAASPPPYHLPDERSASGIKTASTPGGAGSNEVRFEDVRGQEEIYVHAQRDLVVDVLANESRTIGEDASLRIGGDRRKSVGGSENETVGGERVVAIGAGHAFSVAGPEVVAIGAEARRAVAGDLDESVGGSRESEVRGDVTEVTGGALRVSVGKERAERIAGADHRTVEGDAEDRVAGRYVVDVGGVLQTKAGSSIEEIAADKTLRAGTRVEVVCGKGRVVIDEAGRITIEGTDVRIATPGPVEVEGTRLSIKSTGSVHVKAAGSVKVKGSGIDMN